MVGNLLTNLPGNKGVLIPAIAAPVTMVGLSKFRVFHPMYTRLF
jgi:hypothetical protein